MPSPSKTITKRIANTDVNFHLYLGTAFEVDRQLAMSGTEATGLFLKMEEGDSVRLELQPGAVPAIEGDKFCRLDIHGPTFRFDDVRRFNLSRNQYSTMIGPTRVADKLAIEGINWWTLLLSPIAFLVTVFALGLGLSTGLGVAAVTFLAVILGITVYEGFVKRRANKELSNAYQAITHRLLNSAKQ